MKDIEAEPSERALWDLTRSRAARIKQAWFSKAQQQRAQTAVAQNMGDQKVLVGVKKVRAAEQRGQVGEEIVGDATVRDQIHRGFDLMVDRDQQAWD